ncbi:MAG: hypothetical protein NZ775_01665 [Gammaproteobacteria bacterium]|nr:hypothetical protein [Gammaproteobacteria bacterium]
MQVKIFSTRESFRFNFQKALDALEKKVNNWTATNPEISIIDIKQSVVQALGPREVVISIWYEEKTI